MKDAKNLRIEIQKNRAGLNMVLVGEAQIQLVTVLSMV